MLKGNFNYTMYLKANYNNIQYLKARFCVEQTLKARYDGTMSDAVVEYKRAIWEPSTTFTFSKQYVSQPVIVATLSFDYEGEPPTDNNIVGMYPKVELTTIEIEGILYYTGATVTWVGEVPPTLDNAYTNLITVIGV
ncbi:MAG TPA: hypothetical protein PKJ69_08480 [Spirochaetota bacterium]|nr:hypothetical protein [Spirochaetota bacterium]